MAEINQSYTKNPPAFTQFESIVIIVEEKYLKSVKDEGFHLLDSKLLRDRKVDRDYPLKLPNNLNTERVVPSLGSGFFITENTIATAAHVILGGNGFRNAEVGDFRFIRCFHNLEMKKDKYIIPNKNIFESKKGVLTSDLFDYTTRGVDWAVIEVKPYQRIKKKLDPPIPLKCKFQFNCKKGEPLYATGHPFGLSVRNAEGNLIKEGDKTDVFFETAIGVFAGNSGSPIFHYADEEYQVVGIVMRGTRQFVLSDNPNDSSNAVKQIELAKVFSNYEGEECLKIKELPGFVKTNNEKIFNHTNNNQEQV